MGDGVEPLKVLDAVVKDAAEDVKLLPSYCGGLRSEVQEAGEALN